ncbi:DUF4865 family protein [Staphylococcus gallinarum]|uniref:DUF4865 family protein n=1 Tax=Staphylococcus gallinarum TaxID=1293 RepID=UPI002DB90068|nr:DUF4865 family protein [Staphylococcus gallinarum]MEB6276734.1 DUF4865 family protein [Staphylococcus gallinarum]
MIAMQYNLNLPSDYDMSIIKKRVEENGYKTDGFKDLICKIYVYAEKDVNKNHQNSYEPLYIWENNDGMNDFIFKGYFDNIINSFGWTNINIGITYHINLSEEFHKSKYILEEYIDIAPQESLKGINLIDNFKAISDSLGEIIIYNPDKWKCVKYTFVNKISDHASESFRILNIGHISK